MSELMWVAVIQGGLTLIGVAITAFVFYRVGILKDHVNSKMDKMLQIQKELGIKLGIEIGVEQEKEDQKIRDDYKDGIS